MSRGPGAIERAIEAAFTSNPSSTYSVEELAVIAYPGLNRVERKHRVAVLRAAEKAAARCGWQGWRAERPGHPVIYRNPFDVRSYTVGRERCDFVDGRDSVEVIERRLDDPSAHGSKWSWMQPGGAWWLHVEMAKARRDGRDDEAEALNATLQASVRRKMAALGMRP